MQHKTQHLNKVGLSWTIRYIQMQPMYKTQNRQTKDKRPWSVLISRKRGFQIGKEEVEENEAIKNKKSH